MSNITLSSALQMMYDEVKSALDSGKDFSELSDAMKADVLQHRTVIEALQRDYPKMSIIPKRKLSKMSAKYIGELVRLDAEIVGEECGKAKLDIAFYKCKYCATVVKIGVDQDSKPEKCPQCGRKSLKLMEEDSGFKDCTILYVREIIQNVDAVGADEYTSLAAKVWRVEYSGLPLSSSKVTMLALVSVESKTGNIYFQSDLITPLEDVSNAKFTKKDCDKIKALISSPGGWDAFLNGQLAPIAQGRQFAKEAALLVLFSVSEIPDITSNLPNMKIIRGCLRANYIGDTKTCKSLIGQSITIDMLLGEYVDCGSSTRAGITYTINAEDKVIIWGVLPSNDRGFAFLDDIGQLHSDEIGQMRETLEQQSVKVNRMVKGERKARVRVITALNPRNPPMANYIFKVKGLQDTWVFESPIDITRFDLHIPFCADDVNADVIAQAEDSNGVIELDLFKKWVKYVWSLKSNQITYLEGVKETIIKDTEELLEAYDSPYPIVHRGYRNVLTRMAVAYACLKLSFSDDLSRVLVMPEHAEFARRFIDRMIEDLEYDVYVIDAKGETMVTDEEFSKIQTGLDELCLKILKHLAIKGKVSASDLATMLGITDKTVKEHYKHLKAFGLISTSQGYGAMPKQKGITILRRLGVVTSREDKGSKDTSLLFPTSPPKVAGTLYAPSNICPGENTGEVVTRREGKKLPKAPAPSIDELEALEKAEKAENEPAPPFEDDPR